MYTIQTISYKSCVKVTLTPFEVSKSYIEVSKSYIDLWKPAPAAGCRASKNRQKTYLKML